MKISIASDHAGFEYKEKIKEYLEKNGHEIIDFGTDSTERCDYPDFIVPAAGAVANGECERGIILGGSGNGEAMAANRLKKVRAAVCWNEESAKMAAAHNDANVISLGQRMMTLDMAYKIIDTWLATPFEGGRHIPRIKKLDEI